MYENLLYRRGFLLCEDGSGVDLPAPVERWATVALDRFVLHAHPDLRYEVADGPEHVLAVLGRVFDPVNGVAETGTILDTLGRRLAASEDRFFDYLDVLSGRFVLVVVGEDRAFALQDAAGTHALFYDDDSGRCRLASHPEILAEVGGYEQTAGAERLQAVEASWFPGVATPYAEVNLLTPNTLLTLPEREVRRFFPREPLPSNPLSDELVAEVADVFETSVALLDEETDLSLSLSAGLDSRVSLAATRPVAEDVRYNTWRTGEADEEVATVRELCDHLGVECDLVDLSEEPDEEFLDVFMRNTAGMSRWNRCRNAYNLYRRERTGDGIEIRSNVAEVARTFYRDRFMFLPDEVSAETFAKLYAYESHSEYVQDQYAEFVDRTGFTEENLHGYDIYDLFYWECRLGCWLSLWLLETSIAHEELSLYNNRWLLKKLLSVGREHRRSDELFYRVIRELWPDCLDVPVNPHKKSTLAGSKQVDRLLSGAMLRAPASAYMKTRKIRRNM